MNKKNIKKSLILVFNLTVILFLVPFLIYAINNSDLKTENIYSTAVYVEAGGYHGNGSIIKKGKDEIVIVTTKHLLDNGNHVDVTFWGAETKEGNIVYVSEDHDIGFIKVPTDSLSDKTYQNISSIKYRKSVYKTLKQDNIMQYIWLNKEGTCDIKKGRIGNPSWYVEEFNDDMLYNYCNANAGMSGCGAFTENNYYIGMLIGGYDNESACLPLPTILKIYKDEVG